MAYIVNVAQLRVGPSDNEVFKQGDSIDLSSELAAKLLKKAYIRFDTSQPKKIITVVNEPISDNQISNVINESKGDHEDEEDEEQLAGSSAENLNVNFNIDEYVQTGNEEGKSKTSRK